MLSDSDFFKLFIEHMLFLNVLSEESVALELEDLGGISGVIEDELYISAYEQISRRIVKGLSFDELCEFMSDNYEFFSEKADQLYYFTEAMIDEAGADRSDVERLIAVCPEQYRSFLRRRFLGAHG